MTMAIDLLSTTGPSDVRERDVETIDANDPALRALVARRDDRLLRDVGLTRADALGPQGFFWFEWSREREPWSL